MHILFRDIHIFAIEVKINLIQNSSRSTFATITTALLGFIKFYRRDVFEFSRKSIRARRDSTYTFDSANYRRLAYVLVNY